MAAKKRFSFFPLCLILTLILAGGAGTKTSAAHHPANDTVIIRPGIQHNRITQDWKNALASRISSESIDSLATIERELSAEERKWYQLIASKTGKWNGFKDSLLVPFPGVKATDTLFILTGYLGRDDGFTYGYQTVCLDLTALNLAYGKADLPENDNRIDRIFSHEYTHLLHKLWAAKNQPLLNSFRDSILWECIYEGIGMYRSLNPRWMPVHGMMPKATIAALEKLYPIFTDRLTTIEAEKNLTDFQKNELHRNLSRGNVDQKWGAFPMAIWLALEANGDDAKLRDWISKGPAAVVQLAKKYLPQSLKQKWSKTFP